MGWGRGGGGGGGGDVGRPTKACMNNMHEAVHTNRTAEHWTGAPATATASVQSCNSTTVVARSSVPGKAEAMHNYDQGYVLPHSTFDMCSSAVAGSSLHRTARVVGSQPTNRR